MSELYRVQDFVEDMKRVTEKENDPAAIIQRCKPLLGRLLLNPDCIPLYGRELAGLERLRFDVEKKTFVTFASPKYDNC